MRFDDVKPRAFRLICASGDSTVLTVPTNLLAYISDIELDTRNQSGQISTIGIDIRDTYTPQGGSATTAIRKSFGVVAGDVVSIHLESPIHVIGLVELRSNFSGPVASLSVLFE